jgi:hypothetical protein
VEGGDELGHRRHRDPPRSHQADRAADKDRAADQDQRIPVDRHMPGDREFLVPRRHVMDERGDEGDRHAGDAEAVAAPRAFRAGQAAQREDEKGARDQISEGDPGRQSGAVHQDPPSLSREGSGVGEQAGGSMPPVCFTAWPG